MLVRGLVNDLPIVYSASFKQTVITQWQECLW